MGRQRVHHDLWQWNGADAGRRLGRCQVRRPAGQRDELPVDLDRSTEEVDPVDGQPEALARATSAVLGSVGGGNQRKFVVSLLAIMGVDIVRRVRARRASALESQQSGAEAEEHEESPLELDQRRCLDPSDHRMRVAPTDRGERVDHQEAVLIEAVHPVRADRNS